MCINLSVWAARQLCGFPHEAPSHPPCVNPTKWLTLVNFVLKFLGFLIDTRRMLATWPLDKRDKLAKLLDTLSLKQSTPAVGSSPRQLTRIFGLSRHGAFVAPLGILQTLRLQFRLNNLVSKARGTPQQQRRWWGSRRLRLPDIIMHDLASLRATLDQDLYNPRWCRLIGLLTPRDPTITIRTDAATGGLVDRTPSHVAPLHLRRPKLLLPNLWPTQHTQLLRILCRTSSHSHQSPRIRRHFLGPMDSHPSYRPSPPLSPL